MGVVLYSYLRLRLHLKAAGFDVACVDYDWRLGIDVVGRQLAQRIEAEPHAHVHLVAHSMGGLGLPSGAVAARAAQSAPGRAAGPLPTRGSFAGVQAVRGTYPVVRKLARLDQRITAEQLASEVFNTFPSLYHLLPAPALTAPLDLFDVAHWPPRGPGPPGRPAQCRP